MSTLTPNSPAAKAGIKVGDVIISAAGTNTSTIAELMETIGKSKSRELTIQIIRDNESLEINVQPEKRPANTDPRISSLQAYNRAYPEAVYRYYAAIIPFPSDLAITFEKEGNAAAKIRVQRGSKSWEVSEKELHKLPADVRVYAQRLVEATKTARPKNSQPAQQYYRFYSQTAPKAPQSTRRSDAMEKKIDALGKELQQLRKSLQEFKQRDG